MTTLTADESSSELSGHNWLRIVALYGIGPLLAVFYSVWLTKSVSAKQDTQIAIASDTKALVQQHAHETHEDLHRIARQLEVNCRVEALLAKNKAVETLCGVGR
jgi:hypothetical protein